MDMRLELSKDRLYIFEFKFRKVGDGEEADSAAVRTEDAGSDKSPSEYRDRLMADALKAARDWIMEKGYADGDVREYARVHKVAVGIVGRSMARAKLVANGKAERPKPDLS